MLLRRFRFGLTALALLFGAATVSAQDYYYSVYFGTYTDRAGSKGIYRAKLNTTTGKLSEPILAAEATSPSFLAVHPNGGVIYAVGETGGKGGGAVLAYVIDTTSGKLDKLNETTSGGDGPCHISVHPKGKYAAVANYGGGSTAVFKLDEANYKLGDRIGFFQHKGTSADKGRQEAPHAHCSFFEPKGERLLTVDLGIDRVKTFAVDDKSAVKETEDLDIITPPGTGPRHIAIAEDGKIAYLCGELNSTVNVVELGWAPGKNKVVQTLSTLPEPVKGNSTAECILSPDGKFVYVSNRGHNSIAVFKVGDDRKLTAAGHITGDIKTPRNFNIDPSGKWMLIASQDGDKVGVWELDPKTGLGKETGNTVKISKPVCVKFLPVDKLR
jgi:6-phosphogluconolactonase